MWGCTSEGCWAFALPVVNLHAPPPSPLCRVIQLYGDASSGYQVSIVYSCSDSLGVLSESVGDWLCFADLVVSAPRVMVCPPHSCSCGFCPAPQCCPRTSLTIPCWARSTPWASTRLPLGGFRVWERCTGVGCEKPNPLSRWLERACVCVCVRMCLCLAVCPRRSRARLACTKRGSLPTSVVYPNIFRRWPLCVRHTPHLFALFFCGLKPTSRMELWSCIARPRHEVQQGAAVAPLRPAQHRLDVRLEHKSGGGVARQAMGQTSNGGDMPWRYG